MPNHITTRITAPKDAMDFIRKRIVTEETNKRSWEPVQFFDFGRIIPMPENIFQWDLWDRERELYWENNRYDWSIKNRWTKWNSYDFVDDNDCFEFNTARSHPFQVIEQMSKMMPEFEFLIEYADEDIGNNYGKYTIKDWEMENMDIDEDINIRCMKLKWWSEEDIEEHENSKF